MKLFDVSHLNFKEVINQYRKDHSEKEDTWEERNIKRANRKFRSWIKAKVPILEIKHIVMPHYNFEGENITPKEGILLKDAYEIYKSNKLHLEENKSLVFLRIKKQKTLIKNNGVKSIFLSQEPLFIGLSYSGLIKYKNQITHLDGFHRLMALMDMEKKPDFIECYIAVYPDFFGE